MGCNLKIPAYSFSPNAHTMIRRTSQRVDCFQLNKGVFRMGKKNKSKRFIQQGADAVMKHDARFPYRGTLAEAEKARSNSSFGGV